MGEHGSLLRLGWSRGSGMDLAWGQAQGYPFTLTFRRPKTARKIASDDWQVARLGRPWKRVTTDSGRKGR